VNKEVWIDKRFSLHRMAMAMLIVKTNLKRLLKLLTQN